MAEAKKDSLTILQEKINKRIAEQLMVKPPVDEYGRTLGRKYGQTRLERQAAIEDMFPIAKLERILTTPEPPMSEEEKQDLLPIEFQELANRKQEQLELQRKRARGELDYGSSLYKRQQELLGVKELPTPLKTTLIENLYTKASEKYNMPSMEEFRTRLQNKVETQEAVLPFYKELMNKPDATVDNLRKGIIDDIEYPSYDFEALKTSKEKAVLQASAFRQNLKQAMPLVPNAALDGIVTGPSHTIASLYYEHLAPTLAKEFGTQKDVDFDNFAFEMLKAGREEAIANQSNYGAAEEVISMVTTLSDPVNLLLMRLGGMGGAGAGLLLNAPRVGFVASLLGLSGALGSYRCGNAIIEKKPPKEIALETGRGLLEGGVVASGQYLVGSVGFWLGRLQSPRGADAIAIAEREITKGIFKNMTLGSKLSSDTPWLRTVERVKPDVRGAALKKVGGFVGQVLGFQTAAIPYEGVHFSPKDLTVGGAIIAIMHALGIPLPLAINGAKAAFGELGRARAEMPILDERGNIVGVKKVSEAERAMRDADAEVIDRANRMQNVGNLLEAKSILLEVDNAIGIMSEPTKTLLLERGNIEEPFIGTFFARTPYEKVPYPSKLRYERTDVHEVRQEDITDPTKALKGAAHGRTLIKPMYFIVNREGELIPVSGLLGSPPTELGIPRRFPILDPLTKKPIDPYHQEPIDPRRTFPEEPTDPLYRKFLGLFPQKTDKGTIRYSPVTVNDVMKYTPRTPEAIEYANNIVIEYNRNIEKLNLIKEEVEKLQADNVVVPEAAQEINDHMNNLFQSGQRGDIVQWSPKPSGITLEGDLLMSTLIPGVTPKNIHKMGDLGKRLLNRLDRGIWKIPEQRISSINTSINRDKIPAVFNAKGVEFKKGGVNADIGGGSFNNATELLASKGATNIIFDPFNRSREENAIAVEKIRDGKSDTATISNVLNVIEEPANRAQVIAQAANAIKEDGIAYFTVYKGDASGVGAETVKGYQLNLPLGDYVKEIEKYFNNVSVKNGVIFAKEPISTPKAIGGEVSLYSSLIPGINPEKISTFFDPLMRNLDKLAAGKKAQPKQVKEAVVNIAGGTREAKWIGLDLFLEGKETVSKKDLAEFIRQNSQELQEITKVEFEAFAPEEFKRVLTLNRINAEGRLTPEERSELIALKDKQAKWENRVLPGIHENYHEYLITIPNVKRGFKGGHFKEKNVAVFTRSTDRVEKNGGKVKFAEEIQSDWKNAGMKRGFVTKEEMKSITKYKEIKAKGEAVVLEISRRLRLEIREREKEDPSIDPSVEFVDNIDKELKKSEEFNKLNKEKIALFNALVMAGIRNKITSFPYINTFGEIGLKKLLRVAAEENADYLGLPRTAEQVAAIEGWTGLKQDGKGNYVVDQNIEPTRIITRMIQTYPRWLKKYVKKWGGTVEEGELETGDKITLIPITPEMKKSVLTEGQSMYSSLIPIDPTYIRLGQKALGKMMQNLDNIAYRALQEGKSFPTELRNDPEYLFDFGKRIGILSKEPTQKELNKLYKSLNADGEEGKKFANLPKPERIANRMRHKAKVQAMQVSQLTKNVIHQEMESYSSPKIAKDKFVPELPKTVETIWKVLFKGNDDAETKILRLAGEDSELHKVLKDDVLKGWDVKDKVEIDGIQEFKEVLAPFGLDKPQALTDALKKELPITLPSGKEYSFTLGKLLFLSIGPKDPHFERVMSAVYKKGSEKGKQIIHLRERVTDEKINLEWRDIKAIEAYVDASPEYGGLTKAVGNFVPRSKITKLFRDALEVNGYKVWEEGEMHLPLARQGEKPRKKKGITRIENEGHLQQREKGVGTKDMYFDDIFDVIVRHVDLAAKYVGLESPTAKANHLLNDPKFRDLVKERVRNGEKYITELQDIYERTKGYRPHEANQYDRVVLDISHKSIIAVLGNNPGVTLIQAGSVGLAGRYISEEYMMKGAPNINNTTHAEMLTNSFFHKRFTGSGSQVIDIHRAPVTLAERLNPKFHAQYRDLINMKSLTPFSPAWWKAFGKASMQSIRWMDQSVHMIIYEGVKAKFREMGVPEGQIVSMALAEAVKISRATQPQWDPLHASMLMQEGGEMANARIFSTFASQRARMYNMLEKDRLTYVNATPKGKREARKNLANTVIRVTASQMSVALIKTAYRTAIIGGLAALMTSMGFKRRDIKKEQDTGFIGFTKDLVRANFQFLCGVTNLTSLMYGAFEIAFDREAGLERMDPTFNPVFTAAKSLNNALLISKTIDELGDKSTLLKVGKAAENLLAAGAFIGGVPIAHPMSITKRYLPWNKDSNSDLWSIYRKGFVDKNDILLDYSRHELIERHGVWKFNELRMNQERKAIEKK